MDQRSAVSHANPRVVVELAAAKTANAEMRRTVALERKREPSEEEETHGLGFSVLSIESAAENPHTHTDTPPTKNPTAEFL